MNRRILPFAFIWVSFSLAAGCSQSPEDPRAPRAAVSGMVLYKGEKLSEGSIQFTPANGDGFQAFGTIKDGAYAIDQEKGPSVGTHTVKIEAYKDTGKKMETEEGMIAMPEQFLPARYNEKTKLTADVKAEDNDFIHELE